MSSYLLLMILLMTELSAVAQAPKTVTVRGVLKDGNKGEGLEAASIVVENSTAAVVTDQSGSFILTIPPGKYTLQISHSGKSITLPLEVANDTLITLISKPVVKAMQEVIVNSRDNTLRIRSVQSGVETVDRKTALALPAILGEVDIIKVFQLKPGVKNSGEGTSGISVRGGGTDQNLFLLDGTTVYNPNHLFGFFSTFNIDAIKDVQLYKAAFPAEYSGRLSSIVNVNSLRGQDEGISVGGGIGLIASRINLQGNLLPKNKAGKKLTFNIAARRTYADVFTSAINASNAKDTTFNPIPTYYFYDLNARFDYLINETSSIYGSFYYGRDYFKFDSDIFGSTFGWGNTAISLHWKKNYGKGFQSHLSAHLSNYNYLLESKFDRFNFKIGSAVKEYSLSHQFIYTGFKKHQLTFGYQAGLNEFNISTFNINSNQAEETLTSGEALDGTEAGAYLSDDWELSQKLRLNSGVRFTLFNNGKTWLGLEPRLSTRYLFNDNFSIKASYARMQQYKHLVASSGASLPTDIWYPSTANIKPELSDQASLGINISLGGKFLLTNETYYKWMRQLVDYKPGANLLINSTLENEFVFGNGRGYGNEIMLEKTSGKLRGWLGYTLAWTTRQFAAINNGKTFYPRYDRRHELSMVMSYPLAKRITLSGSWTYYTGNAVSLPTGRTIGIDAPGSLDASTFFTLAPVFPERSNYRMPDYHRLDIGMVYKLKTKRGSSDITISAYNAYSRLNPYFISFEPTENSNVLPGTPQGFTPKAVTLFPIIPSITYNFKF